MSDEKSFSISFGETGNAQEFQRAGWSRPETNYTWTQGGRSTLEIPSPSPYYDHLLRVVVQHAFLYEGQNFQRIILKVNSVAVAHEVVVASGSIEAWIPRDLVAKDTSNMTLTMELPDARRPIDVQKSSDDRMLSVSIKSIDLVPLPPSATQRGLSDAAWSLENLGQNCEVGLVQRRAGAEPLGLLRFSTSRLDQLLPALDAKFESFGDVEDLKFEVHGTNGFEEWMIKEQRYGFTIHTQASPNVVSLDQIRKRETRRLPWLAKKLMADLESAEKLFVFQGDLVGTTEKALPLVQAIRRYGPNRLLLVCADFGKRGKVTQSAEHCFEGFVSELHDVAHKDTICWDDWISLLPVAVNLWNERK